MFQIAGRENSGISVDGIDRFWVDQKLDAAVSRVDQPNPHRLRLS